MARTLYQKLWDSHLVREDGRRHPASSISIVTLSRGDEPAGVRKGSRSTTARVADGFHRRHRRSQRPHDAAPRGEGIADPISRLQVETLDHNIDKFHVKTYSA
jgi:3-isopropylmalate/(R)-2-methylmalate dehydratase large subunit